MATANSRARCFTCKKDRPAYSCNGCSHEFCSPHLNEHQQMLHEQLNQIIHEHDQFKQTISEQKQNPPNSTLLNQIDQWEKISIETIQRTAKECREVVIGQTRRVLDEIEEKLDQFTTQLKDVREENDVNEIDLQRLTNKLTEMTKELNEPSNIFIQEESRTLIKKIHVSLSNPRQKQDQDRSTSSPKESKYHKWKQQANTVARGDGGGQQVCLPQGISVDPNKNILIADYFNHRIVRWEWQTNTGTVIAGGNGRGNRTDQLNGPIDVIVDKDNHSLIIADQINRRVIRWIDQNQPNQEILVDNIDCRGLAMDKEGCLYVCDHGNHRVMKWRKDSKEGTIVAGGNGLGNQLNQLNYPQQLFVNDEQSVYVSDNGNHRVIKWRKGAKEGVIVAGGNGEGNRLNQLSYPYGVIVDRWGQIYVADFGNDRVMRWREGGREGEIVVGGNGRGQGANQLSNPKSLSFDDEGNLYVADYGNYRLQKFDLIL